jgi:hypothetical protein
MPGGLRNEKIMPFRQQLVIGANIQRIDIMDLPPVIPNCQNYGSGRFAMDVCLLEDRMINVRVRKSEEKTSCA